MPRLPQDQRHKYLVYQGVVSTEAACHALLQVGTLAGWLTLSRPLPAAGTSLPTASLAAPGGTGPHRTPSGLQHASPTGVPKQGRADFAEIGLHRSESAGSRGTRERVTRLSLRGNDAQAGAVEEARLQGAVVN